MQWDVAKCTLDMRDELARTCCFDVALRRVRAYLPPEEAGP